ncbi:MAG: hypothetical protein WBC48_02895 [Minisyncoccales bacterium]
MDDIGLGKALANVLYIFILFITIVGTGLLFFLGKKKFAFWRVSVMANVFAYLYFLGDSSLIGWVIRVYSIIVWPVANIAWLVYLILNRKKNKKSR